MAIADFYRHKTRLTGVPPFESLFEKRRGSPFIPKICRTNGFFDQRAKTGLFALDLKRTSGIKFFRKKGDTMFFVILSIVGVVGITGLGVLNLPQFG